MIDENRLTRLFCELVAIDSPSRGERQMADRVTVLLRELGCEVEEDQAGQAIGGNCGNLYARLAGTLPGAPLLLSVHLDTVEPSAGKQALIGEDGVIRSSGRTILGADDLAGVTAILEAIRSTREKAIPHRSLEILLTVAEEQHLTGSHHLEVHRLKAREAYVLDTSGEPGLAVLQAPGHIALTFEIQGQAAHAGIAPETGISAIQVAARGIAAMQLGRVNAVTTANIGRIEGGGETNVVADYCRVTAECRSLDTASLRLQADHMRSAMLTAAEAAGARVDVVETPSYQPYQVDPNHRVVRSFVTACEELGLKVRLTSTGGGSDNNILSLHGITGIVLSCGMAKVHSCQEEIRIRDLVDTARLVQALICQPSPESTERLNK